MVIAVVARVTVTVQSEAIRKRNFERVTIEFI